MRNHNSSTDASDGRTFSAPLQFEIQPFAYARQPTEFTDRIHRDTVVQLFLLVVPRALRSTTRLNVHATIDVIMSKRPSRIFAKLEIKAALAMHAGWRVSMSEQSNPVFHFLPPEMTERRNAEGRLLAPPLRAEADVDDVLDAFLGIDDAEAALLFFRKFGPMDLDRLYGSRAKQISFNHVLELRERRRAALHYGSTLSALQESQRYRQSLPESNGAGMVKSSSRKEREDLERRTIKALPVARDYYDRETMTSPEVQLSRTSKGVLGTILSRDVRSATAAAVFLDQLGGFGWGTCKECLHPFKRASRHKRIYCSEQCQTYASTQKNLNPHRSVKARRAEKRRDPDASRTGRRDH